jgi:phage terminase small subunit
MPRLTNPRHERFAREYLKCGVASKAYIAAGYQPSTRNALDASASQLLRTPKVQGLLQQYRARAMKRSDITVETLLADLETDRALAHCEGQGSAAVQATMAKARLLGLIVDRKETGKPGEFEGLQTVDDVITAVRTEFGDKTADALASTLQAEQAAGQAERQAPRTRAPTREPTNSGSGSVN